MRLRIYFTLIGLLPLFLVAQQAKREVSGQGRTLAVNNALPYWVEPGMDADKQPVAYRSFNRHTSCDDCSETISLPFDFTFYGNTYRSVYLNANGNITFGGSLATFTPESFCLKGPMMVAPFFADADLQKGGELKYLIADHYFIATWTGVTHFHQQGESPTGLTNTFQVLIHDGTLTAINGIDFPANATVLFSYRDMQWTTGHSSGGVGGLGGTAATVGLNQGDGLTCHAFGRFDHEGEDLTPYSETLSGVSALDYRHIAFNGADASAVDLEASQSRQPQFSATEWKLFPNPCTTTFRLQTDLANDVPVTYVLRDITGRLADRQVVYAESGEIAFERQDSWAPGMYFVEITFEGGHWSSTLLIR